MRRAWRGSIAFEDVPTSDGRTLVEGRSDWTGRLPRPLMGPSHSDQAQNGWQPVGSVQEVTVSEGVVTASGYVVVDSIPAGEHGVAVSLGSLTSLAPGEMYGTLLALHLLADGADPAWPAARITIEEADSDDQ